MNKRTFIWILQSALLSWDGVTEKELLETYTINPLVVRAGINLCNYLKKLEVLETKDV